MQAVFYFIVQVCVACWRVR